MNPKINQGLFGDGGEYSKLEQLHRNFQARPIPDVVYRASLYRVSLGMNLVPLKTPNTFMPLGLQHPVWRS
jgi:hypothetical protein